MEGLPALQFLELCDAAFAHLVEVCDVHEVSWELIVEVDVQESGVGGPFLG